MKIKVIGTIKLNELAKRTTRANRKVKQGGTLIGSVIVTDIKGIPGVNYARCTIRRNRTGLHAIRNGVYIRQVPVSVLKDTSFKPIE